ncbi:hypothetical protein LOTGIDRAFT_233032 [Lottia gigantea]|uniref:Uncharacterized protein n=1 Tax=Lottia gigantea TaxID=225164 RepID=V4ABX1_LOTGI|nr:hypothetical protein LOTGIDRAFT_233032 [Lottia gigantea]ESO92585.1 hypothetical protein LOTGIDRAFT_233032 [Lottia gigantea]
MKMAANIILSKVYIGKETENRLVSSAGQGDISSVLKLLRKRVNPNLRDEVGVTALARAAAGHHTETVKYLILAGAKLDCETSSGVRPINFTRVKSETWQVLLAASHGEIPEIEEINEVPDVPDFAIEGGAAKSKTKSGKKKKGKKGKKGGKKGKKKGKKK